MFGATKHVTWTVPVTGEQIRLTCGTCSIAQEGRRNALLRAEQAAFESRHGTTAAEVAELIGAEEEAADHIKELWLEVMLMWDWAVFMAGLRSMERHVDDEWEPVNIPDEWGGFDAFTEDVPADLLRAGAEATVACNPSLWDSPEGKGAGGVNMT